MSSSRNRRRNRKKYTRKRASTQRRWISKFRAKFSSHSWIVITIAAIMLVAAVVVIRPVVVKATRSPESDIASVASMSSSSMGNNREEDTSPYPYFEPDTEVLIYTGHGESGWQSTPFRMVPRGVEFLFDKHFYDINPDGWVRVNTSVEADTMSLSEADRSFEPYNSRWPEPEDLVRFVGQNNQHLLHNRAGACQGGDYFWFQGVLYGCIAAPDNPSELIVKSTYYVFDTEGQIMPVEEFALARGDSLDEVYGVQLASLSASNVQSATNSGGGHGMPTDFGFAGGRYDDSTGLIQMGDRWYDPQLGRFIQPDTIVPEANNPMALDRYAYTANNPLKYVDTSGHCWGPASFIRGLPTYGTTCNNLDMALTIAAHPEASTGEKVGAVAYIATEGTAHLALAVGDGILAWEGGAAVVGTLGGAEAAGTAGTVGTAACADGDCTNEVNAAAQAARSVWELHPFQRGVEIENMLGRSSFLSQNFPVIDRFRNGIATSIKSINLNAASYQNISTLTSRITGYVNTSTPLQIGKVPSGEALK